MNAAAKRFSGWSSGRKAAVAAAALLLLGLIAFGGWSFFNDGTTPDDSKRALWKYLRKEARTKNFKPDLDLSAAELAKKATPTVVPEPSTPSVIVTNASPATNRTGRLKTVKTVAKVVKTTGKAATGVVPETSFSPYFRTNQMQAETYEDMYRLIGQQLFVAEQLFVNTDPQQQIIALAMSCEASEYARTNAQNLWLAARICEAYLWPNMALAESTNRVLLTPDALLNVCDNAFQEAGETNNIIRNYEIMIAKVSRSPAYKDLLRYRLAHIYQDLGEEEKALPLLKEIKNYRMNRVPQEIAAMEQRLKSK